MLIVSSADTPNCLMKSHVTVFVSDSLPRKAKTTGNSGLQQINRGKQQTVFTLWGQLLVLLILEFPTPLSRVITDSERLCILPSSIWVCFGALWLDAILSGRQTWYQNFSSCPGTPWLLSPLIFGTRSTHVLLHSVCILIVDIRPERWVVFCAPLSSDLTNEFQGWVTLSIPQSPLLSCIIRSNPSSAIHFGLLLKIAVPFALPFCPLLPPSTFRIT